MYNSVIKPIGHELEAFKKYFHSLFYTDEDDLRPLLKRLSRQDGKMLRPVLVLLTAKYFGFPTERIYNVAAAVELLHTSTLIHDDVVDNSMLRRGKESFNALFDNKIAVLFGDYVVAMSLAEMAKSGDLRNIQYMSALSRTLSSGELSQLFVRSSNAVSEESYYDIITRKTASLFSDCARMSATTCGATEREVQYFADFGLYAGICFQIKDDIFDYFPSSDTGKPSGNDMSEGKLTLPAIYAISTSETDMSDDIISVRNLTATPDQLSSMTDFAIARGGIEYAEKRMADYSEKALACLPHNMSAELKEAFASYIQLIVNRNR